MSAIRKVFWFSLGSILGAGFSFITVPICTFFLLPNEYGKASMFNLFYSIAVIGILFGYDQSYIREFNEENNKKRLLSNVIIVPSLITLAIMILLFSCADKFSVFLFGSKNYLYLIYMIAILLPFLLIERFCLVKLRMEEKAFEYSLYSLLSSVIAFVLTTISIFVLSRRDFLAIVCSTIGAHYILGTMLIFIYHKDLMISIKEIDKKLLLKITKYAIPLALTTIIGQVFSGMDRFFLRVYSDYSELGYYQTSLSLANVIGLIQTIFTTVWIPVAYRWQANKERNDKFEKVQELSILLCVVAYGVILIMIPVIKIFIGDKYDRAFVYFPFLAMCSLITIVTSTTVLGIDFSRKTEILLLFNLITIVMNGLLNYVFIKNIGSIGVAIATCVSTFTLFILKTIYSRKLWFDFNMNNIIFFIISIIIMTVTDVLFECKVLSYIIIAAIITFSMYKFRDSVKIMFNSIMMRCD